MLESGVDINLSDLESENETPLTSAIAHKYFKFAILLIDKGANINLLGYEYDTPLSWAVKSENLDFITSLINMGADVNLSYISDVDNMDDGDTPLG